MELVGKVFGVLVVSDPRVSPDLTECLRCGGPLRQVDVLAGEAEAPSVAFTCTCGCVYLVNN